MSSSLPLDFFHILATIISTSSTLSTLALTSKCMNKIFTPALYTHIHLQDVYHDPILTISKLPRETHLRHTRTFYIGRGVYGGSSKGPYIRDNDALRGCVRGMERLESLIIVQDMYCFNFSPQCSNHVALAILSHTQTFRSLHLECTQDNLKYFPTVQFRNLRSLALKGMPYYGDGDGTDIQGIATMLAASPQLQELALSEHDQSERGHENHGRLYELCSAFHALRLADPSIELLRLRVLDLGKAFSHEPGWAPEDSDDEGGNDSDAEDERDRAYMSTLTDLSFLEELKVANYMRLDWWNHIQPHILEDWMLFSQAINLRKMNVQRLTQGVLDFISRIRAINPSALTEIGGLDDDHNCTVMRGEPDIFEGNALFAYPSSKLGEVGGWKKIEFHNTWKGRPEELRTFEQYCVRDVVEELSCEMTMEELEHFKTTTLPLMTGLKTLIIPRAKGAFVLSERQATIRQRRFRLPQSEIKLAAQQEEETRLALAEELFGISLTAWEERGCVGEKLSRLGLGTCLYAFLFPVLEEVGQHEVGRRRAVRVGREEAMGYDAIRRLEEHALNYLAELE